MRTLLLVLVISVVVYSQQPYPCQSPPQWEAREFKIDRKENYEEHRRLSYDETNKRERKVAEVEFNSTRNFYDVLSLWNENKEYILDLKTRKCNITALNRPFHYRGVHPEAKFDGEVEIGAAGFPMEHINVQIFSANETDGSYYTGFVTYPGCVPVMTNRFSGQTGFESSQYYDITVGITDPMVFIPPSECTSR